MGGRETRGDKSIVNCGGCCCYSADDFEGIPQMENFNLALGDESFIKDLFIERIRIDVSQLNQTDYVAITMTCKWKFMTKLCALFRSTGAESQIISATLRPDFPLELCDAWLGAHGISLSQHASARYCLDHVLSVRAKMKK